MSFNSAFGIIKAGPFSFILAHFLQFSMHHQPLPEAGTERLTFRDRAKSQPLSLRRCFGVSRPEFLGGYAFTKEI